MLNRLTISALLKSVIAVMAACVVAFLIMTAWDSWGRLQTAARISVIADGSAHAFQAMHNLRTDRATVSQNLKTEDLTADSLKTLQGYRDLINPALRSLLDLTATVEFPDRSTLLPSLTRQVDALKALQTETMEAFGKPVASRRPALGKEYFDATTTLQTLEKLATQLAAAVNHIDPVVDQLLAIKQLAWLVRDDTGGQAAVLVVPGLPADACRRKRARPTPNSPTGRNIPGKLWKLSSRERNCRPAWPEPWPQPRRPISNRRI